MAAYAPVVRLAGVLRRRCDWQGDRPLVQVLLVTREKCISSLDGDGEKFDTLHDAGLQSRQRRPFRFVAAWAPFIPQKNQQNSDLHSADTSSVADRYAEGSLARRWCKGRSDASSTPSVCKRLMGNFTSLDLFLNVKARENPFYCPAIVQTDIHQTNSRKGELITSSSHQPHRCQFSYANSTDASLAP
jgi:hypothetical protein